MSLWRLICLSFTHLFSLFIRDQDSFEFVLLSMCIVLSCISIFFRNTWSGHMIRKKSTGISESEYYVLRVSKVINAVHIRSNIANSLPSIKHIVEDTTFHRFPIHIPSASIHAFIRRNAHVREERDQVSDTLYLSQRIKKRLSAMLLISNRS